MSREERTLLRGRLATQEELQKALEIGISCDIDELRSLADKYEPKVDLKTERILFIAQRLREQQIRLLKIVAEIKSLKSDLGGE